MHYERRRWWFNEGLSTFTSSTLLQNYSISADVLIMDYLELRRSSGNTVRLNEIPWSRYLDEWRYNAASGGQPVDWSYYADMIWLGPTPANSTYVLTLGAVRTLDPTTWSDGTVNAWTTFADDLLVARAELAIEAKLLGSETRDLQVLQIAEKEAYFSLCMLNEGRLMSGITRPWNP